MNFVAAIGKFFYDLLIGDSWPLTLAMVLVILAGMAVAELTSVPSSALAVGMAVAASATASLTVVIEARRAHGTQRANR